jgi:long-chain acyl-CoA synthetase
VERVLVTHPSVTEAAVVGLDSPQGGEELVAAIVLTEGATLDAEALRAHAKLSLAAYKVPRRFAVLDALPTSLIGKVLRRDVREQLQAQPAHSLL